MFFGFGRTILAVLTPLHLGQIIMVGEVILITFLMLLSWVGSGVELRIPVPGLRVGTPPLLARTTTFQVAAFVTT